MKNKSNVSVDLSILIPFLLGMLYILFPSNNNSNDAYAYAGSIKAGDLFSYHHLLFNAFGYLWVKLIDIQNVLNLVCIINALFAVGCLYCLRSILLYRLNKNSVGYILLLVGASYGFMRFSTDGETYIIPLFFSLLASYSLLYYRSPFVVSLLAAIACLFHQIHFFWWLGLGLYFLNSNVCRNRKKSIIYYMLGASIVPLVYWIAFSLNPADCDNIIQYIFHDYIFIKGIGFSLKHALTLTPISFIRTFIQIHGYMYPLLVKHPWIIIGILLSLACFISTIKRCNGVITQSIQASSEIMYFTKCHLYILILQFVFAFYSNGNAEFMVMLPFVLSICILFRYDIDYKFVRNAGLGLLFWNMTVGILPYHLIDINPHKVLVEYICKHPQNVYYLTDLNQIKNMTYYYRPDLDLKLHGNNVNLEHVITNEQPIYTDLFYNHIFLSRGKMVENKDESEKLIEYSTPSDTLNYDLGEWYISTIKAPLVKEKK